MHDIKDLVWIIIYWLLFIFLLFVFFTPKRAQAATLSGTASYYSEKGCIGCSPELRMANGQRLNDQRLTLAMTPKAVKTYRLLNKNVIVVNRANGKRIVATVTDTGGFARYARIADLSVATKQAIGCSDLCKVIILF